MTAKMKPKVIAIYRVSTEEQAAKDRAGLNRQKEAVARVVAQHDLDVISEIELVGVSGTNVGSSPQFREMLRKISSREIGGVVVSSLDRLARPDTFESMSVLDNFKEAKALIYAEGEVLDLATKEGRMTAQIKLAFHGYDRSNIVERSATAKEIKRTSATVRLRRPRHPATCAGTPARHHPHRKPSRLAGISRRRRCGRWSRNRSYAQTSY